MGHALSQEAAVRTPQSGSKSLDPRIKHIRDAQGYQMLAACNIDHPDALSWLESARANIDAAIELVEGR